MQFGILGPLEVRADGQVLPLGGIKQRTLLAALLLESNRVIAAPRLIDILWGEEPTESAANALQVHISRLRKILEPGHAGSEPYTVLVSQAPGYFLRVRPGELDLECFQQLAKTARDHLAADKFDSAARMLHEALGLWRGPPLADSAPGPFTDSASGRLDELRLRALEDRVEADLALGRHADVLSELELLAAEHPLRERVCGQLMLALYRSGRQADASKAYHRIRAALDDAQAMEPGPALEKLFQDILNHQAALDSMPGIRTLRSVGTHNLPIQLTTFVGRTREVADLARLLSEFRLLSLVGAGGIGKSRLAIQVASELLADFSDGVWLVELAPVVDPKLVAQSVLHALDLHEQTDRSHTATLIEHLRTLRVLLVLDNCEHLLGACAELVEGLLTHCANLHVVATSRERLNVGGEHVWPVVSLGVPDVEPLPPIDALSTFESVRLFVDRAVMALPSFALDAQNAPALARICARLDGIPLALELAAARVNALGLDEMLVRLDRRFLFLTGGLRTAHPRQRTMRATVEWSHNLLDAREKALFRRLSVFAGTFSLRAAEEVCSNETLPLQDILDTLARLVDKSLVASRQVVGVVEYRLLDTLRTFAREQLVASHESEPTRCQHAAYFLGRAAEESARLNGPEHEHALQRVAGEHADSRAAFEYLRVRVPDDGLRLAWALSRFWDLQNRLEEGLDLLSRALESAPQPSELRLRTLGEAGWLTWRQGKYGTANALLLEALDVSRQMNIDLPTTVLNNLGLVALCEGRLEDAQAHLTRSLAVEFAPPLDRATAINFLGAVAYFRGDLASSHNYFTQLLGASVEVGDSLGMAVALGYLGNIALAAGNATDARAHLRACITALQGLGGNVNLPFALEALARLEVVDGQPIRALRLAGAAVSLRAACGAATMPPWAAQVEPSLDVARQQLGDGAVAAWAYGGAMTTAQVVAFALEEPSDLLVPVSQWHQRSPSATGRSGSLGDRSGGIRRAY